VEGSQFLPVCRSEKRRIWGRGGMIEKKTEVLEKNLHHCHVVHDRSEWICLGSNPGLYGERSATNRLCRDTAKHRERAGDVRRRGGGCSETHFDHHCCGCEVSTV
jgi:hypothetical protein